MTQKFRFSKGIVVAGKGKSVGSGNNPKKAEIISGGAKGEYKKSAQMAGRWPHVEAGEFGAGLVFNTDVHGPNRATEARLVASDSNEVQLKNEIRAILQELAAYKAAAIAEPEQHLAYIRARLAEALA